MYVAEKYAAAKVKEQYGEISEQQLGTFAD
jgi:hypothetical protein